MWGCRNEISKRDLPNYIVFACRSADEVSVSESTEEYTDRQEKEKNESLERKFSELWLHAGRLPEGRPHLRQWEVSHELERMLQQMSLPEALDKVDLGRRVWRSGLLLSDLGDVGERFIMTTPSLASSILVSDAIFSVYNSTNTTRSYCTYQCCAVLRL